jgi:DNA-binding transcriptional ArsR family regulator
MSYQSALEILADPTRRTIVERLRAGPAPVVDIATGLPVSRPAVSKHLRLMLDAGVVRMRTNGTRHLYELDLNTLDEVRRWLDGFWDDALRRFKTHAEQAEEKRPRKQGKGDRR